ncbi:MAG: hypothetical protein NC097_08255 [Clostridium sp.]|nr:phospholipase [Prevotella sp.]MCM1429767.1 hypothetical protein [Clostridium sp.]MCM1476063.1 phospholipase [Muribaculaceae bacterium]
MVGAVIILLITVCVGFFLWVGDRHWRLKHPASGGDLPATGAAEASKEGSSVVSAATSHGEICCGRHLICEKSLSPEPGEAIVYFDDEELDRFAGRESDSYVAEEADEFREVMLTMDSAELPAWVRSLQLRDISFPESLRDELFMLLE